MADPRVATLSNAAKSAAPAAWYAAAVVGLAAFLATLLVSHPPIEGYRVEVCIRPSAHAGAESVGSRAAAIDPAAVEQWLKSDATLAQIAGHAEATSSAGSSGYSGDDLAALRDHLQLVADFRENDSVWTLSFEGRNRKEANRVAVSAAETLAAYLDQLADPRPTETEIAAIRRELRSYQDQEARLRGNIEDLRHEQLARTLQRQPSPPAETARMAADVKSTDVDRRRSILQKIDDLRIEFRQLTATRLASHPAVAAVAGQIEQLEVQLRELPDSRSITPANPSKEHLPLHGPSASRKLTVTNAAYISSHAAASSPIENDSLTRRLDEARRQLREVDEQQKGAERRLETAMQLASTAWQKQWTVAQYGQTQRVGGAPNQNELLWAGLVGVFAATVISIDWNRLGPQRVLATVNHARKALPTPLLGEIPLPAARPIAREAAISPLKLRVIRVAEWTLIVALFLIILAAVSQRELARQFVSDPFGGMAEAFDNVRALVR